MRAMARRRGEVRGRPARAAPPREARAQQAAREAREALASAKATQAEVDALRHQLSEAAAPEAAPAQDPSLAF